MTVLALNKKARANYQVLEKLEAGISLLGLEVKSLRERGVSLKGTYVVLRHREGKLPEVFWIGANIPPYQPKNTPSSYDSQRARRLLLKKSEIRHLLGKVQEKGLTLVPLKLYTKGSKLKLEIALAKGKRKFDKRAALKKRAIERAIRRILRRG